MPMDSTGRDLSNVQILSLPLPAVHNPFGPGEPLYFTQSDLPVATSGDLTDPDILFSLLTIRGLLQHSNGAALTWPAFTLLGGATRASKPARFRMALSALVLEAHLVFGGCFLISRAWPAPVPDAPTRKGRELHS